MTPEENQELDRMVADAAVKLDKLPEQRWEEFGLKMIADGTNPMMSSMTNLIQIRRGGASRWTKRYRYKKPAIWNGRSTHSKRPARR